MLSVILAAVLAGFSLRVDATMLATIKVPIGEVEIGGLCLYSIMLDTSEGSSCLVPDTRVITVKLWKGTAQVRAQLLWRPLGSSEKWRETWTPWRNVQVVPEMMRR